MNMRLIAMPEDEKERFKDEILDHSTSMERLC